MKTSVNIESLSPILAQAGMPREMVSRCYIEPVAEGDLAITFKVTLSGEKIFFLKFSEIEGAKGGPFLKHLIPVDQAEVRGHAEKRRRVVRKIFDWVVKNHRSTLVPCPCYFDLSDDVMTLQKAKEKEGVFSECRISSTCVEPLLTETVATLWTGLNLAPLPLAPEKTNIWNVTSYTPEILFECSSALGELQREASKYVDMRRQAKLVKGRGSVDQIRIRIEEKLKHEQKALLGYDKILDDFLLALEISDLKPLEEALQQRGEKLAQLVAQKVADLGGSSVGGLQKQFRDRYPIPRHVPIKETELYVESPFKKLIFAAERERWWTFDVRCAAKVLVRLEQAEILARSLKTEPGELATFIDWLKSFKTTYVSVEACPRGLVHQDPSPVNLQRNLVDGKISLIDLEEVSWDIRFADISRYICSILQAFNAETITFQEAAAMVQATFDGYHSQVSERLTQDELGHITDYGLALALNFLPQFGFILRLVDGDLNKFNLAMSLDDFLKQVRSHQKLCQLWSEKFLPAVFKFKELRAGSIHILK